MKGKTGLGQTCTGAGHSRQRYSRTTDETVKMPSMDEVRKRVIRVMAAILVSRNIQTADDLFGGPQGSPRTEKIVAASIQRGEKS